MANILMTLEDKGERRVTAIEAKEIAETALLELDTFKKQLVTVCATLVAEDGSAAGEAALPGVLSSLDELPQPENVHLAGDVESLRLLIVKQRTENIKLKQALSQLTEQKRALENEISRIGPLKQIEEFQMAGDEDTTSLCERLESELQTTYNKLKEMEFKYRVSENECLKVQDEKSCIRRENNKLEEKVKFLDSRVQELTDQCSSIEMKSFEEIHILQEKLSKSENNIKCLEDEKSQYQTELCQSKELRDILECELKEIKERLESMRNKCLQYENVLENRREDKGSSSKVDHKSSESREFFESQISDLKQKYSVADELLKQKMSDCYNLKEENDSLHSSLEKVSTKSKEMQLLIDDLMTEMKNKDDKIFFFHQCMSSMESSLLEKEKLIGNTIRQLELLQKCVPLFLNSKQKAVSDSSESGLCKEVSDIDVAVEQLQHSMHQANIVYKFTSVVKSAVIMNLRKKIENYEEKLEELECQLQSYNRNDVSDSNESGLCKEVSDIDVAVEQQQHSMRQANIVHKFTSVVKSAVIVNLRKKIENYEEKLKELECQLPAYNRNDVSPGDLPQTCYGNHMDNAPSLFSQLTDEGIEAGSHAAQSRNTLHTNDCKGNEIILFNSGAPGDSSFFGEPDKSKFAELAQEEIKEMECKILELEDQLKVKVLALNTYEKEKELLRAHISKEAEQRSRMESHCDQLKIKVDSLRSEVAQLQEQNEELKKHSFEAKTVMREIEKERMLLVKQLNDKSECSEKYKENFEQAFKKIRELESVCAQHSVIHEKCKLEFESKNAEIDKLSNELKMKTDHIAQLEKDIEERDRVLQQQDESLRKKSHAFSTLELEISNSKCLVQSLQKDLKNKSGKELDLEREINALRMSTGDKDITIDCYQKAMREKDEVLTGIKGGLMEKENLIKDLSSRLQNVKSHADMLEAGLMEKEKLIETLKVNLHEKNCKIEHLLLSVEGKVKLIEDLQNEIHARGNEAAFEVKKRDTFMNDMKEKLSEMSRALHEKMDASEKQKEECIKELQHELKNHRVRIESLNSKMADKDKEIDQLKVNLSESVSIISKLQEDLKHKCLMIEKLKFGFDEKCALVKSLEQERMEFVKIANKLESDLENKVSEFRAKEEMVNKLESEYKAKVTNLEHKIIDLEKQLQEYRARTSEEFVPSFEPVVPKSNLKSKKQDSRQQATSSSYELKAVLAAEKESCSSFEGKWLLQKEHTLMASHKAADLSVKDTDDLRRKLKATELSLKECRKQKAKLESMLQELVYNQGKDSAMSEKLLESELALRDSDVLCHLHTSKWSLQWEVLKLQAEIFKDSPPNLEKHMNFIKSMKELHSQACATRKNDVTEEYSLRLKLDLEFLENVKLLLMHFVIPLLKETLNSETTSCKSELFDLVGTQHKRYQIGDRNLTGNNKNMKGGLPVQSVLLSKGIDGSDKESALSSDNGIPMSRTESQSSFPSSYDSRFSNDSHCHRALEKLCQNYLSGGQIGKAGDEEDAKIPDAMHLRSNYSSPDLGIESDPNQEVPAADAFGSQNYLPNAMSTESMSNKCKVLTRELNAGDASLYVIGVLQDFELLKKEIQECKVEMKSIYSRAADGLQQLSKNTTPKKILEHSTLKGILDGCGCIEMCLGQAEHLTNKFNIMSSPMSESTESLVSLVMENQDLKGRLDELQSKVELQEQKYFSTMDELKNAKKRNVKIDRLIAKELVETQKVLRKTKTEMHSKTEVLYPKSSSS